MGRGAGRRWWGGRAEGGGEGEAARGEWGAGAGAGGAWGAGRGGRGGEGAEGICGARAAAVGGGAARRGEVWVYGKGAKEI